MSTTTPHTQTAYKDTPIGKIPADWEVKKLGDVIKLGNGKDYKHLNNGDIPVWGTGGIITYVDDYLFDGLSIGIGRKGSIDKPVLLSGKFWTVDTLFYVNEFKGIEVEFAFNLFNSINWMKYNEATGLPSLSQKNILNIPIPLPPLSEQKRIAEVLSTWDQAIQLTEQLIRQKEQRKKWLMQNLLTGKMRLKGFSGTKWHLRSLGDIAFFQNGKGHENYIVENGAYIVVNSKFISSEGKTIKFSNSNLSPLSKGEIVMVMSDVPNGKALGKCFLIDKNETYTLNQRICSIKAKEGVCNIFLYYILNRNSYFLSFDNGVGQTNIKKDEVLECPLNLPSIEEQTAIAEVLQTADKEIELLKAKAEQLKEQKKGLMQQLLTGKKRLNLNLQD